MITKQFGIGILIIFAWFLLAGLEVISPPIFFTGMIGFTIGAKLVLWECGK